ncbi:DUF262 domain-containing protein [Vitreimonas flagellata]|uniref:DUF262 domain-containing protein n=1 Tax=Vitreimonas flagellata TaxID=2560861 RepID=UPI001EF937F1|nr:DUF262 domain-containing protein [Vitreimonas flagellata]
MRKLAQGDESGDPAGLQSKIVTIADLLKRNLGLKVPRYQRPFTWSEREVVQLIEDMRRTMREDRLLYFLGQMMLVEQSSGAPELTDGQQRLVTLSMLFAAIRDRMLEGGDHVQSFLIGEEGRPRLHLRDGDAAFFRAFVLEPGHFHALVAHRSTGVASLDAMIEAARAIDDALAPLSQAEYAELANFISQRCQVNLVYATDNKLMLSVFENLNQRGARLSAADIIKSDLIENSEFSQDDANLAAKLWAIAETRLSREDFAKLLFLSPTLMGANALSTPHDTHGFRRAVEQACGIREFLFDRLPRFAEAAGELMSLGVDAKEHTDEVRRRLFLMHQLETWDWFPSAVAFLAERPDPQKVRDFFCALELFAFAGELMAIDFRTLAERYRRALRQLAVANADAALAEIRLRPEEIMKLAATLNRSRKRDRQRRLMLLRVEAALPGGALLSLADDISVEHILPKSASFVWARSFPDAAKRAELCDLLGNLTLVSTQQAQQTETKPYAEKLKVLFDRRWPALALTRDLEGIEAWTEDAIETRQERLVHALLHDWGIAQPQAPPADAAV